MWDVNGVFTGWHSLAGIFTVRKSQGNMAAGTIGDLRWLTAQVHALVL